VTIHNFPESQIISDITFRETENGSVRAYIHARDGADTANALKSMRDKNYACTPFLFEDKPMVEVRGFGKEHDLLTTLKLFLPGESTITQEAADKHTWYDQFRKRTLQLTGFTYLVGDVGFVAYGYKEADKLVMAGAFSYFLGTLALMFYGRNDQSDLQVKDLSKELESFLCKQGAPLPKESALQAVLQEKEKTFLQSADDFGKRYPSEIFNTVTALAGVFIAASAYKNKIKITPTAAMDAKALHEMHLEGWMDFGLGTLTALSGTFATLVKEKKPDPDEPPKTGLSWVWQQINAHPLAISGVGYAIATTCHAASTYKAYKEAKRVGDTVRLANVPWRGLFVGAAFASEFLLAISSKGHGEGVVSDNSIDCTALAIAADFIARQPEQSQQQLIEATTEFLGEAKHLAMKNDEVAKFLREQVASLRNNPWMLSEKKTQQAAPVSDAVMPVAAPGKGTDVPTSWQAKVLASQQVQPSLGA